MKTSTKILLGFLAVIVFGLTQMGITYKLQCDILENAKQMKNVEAPRGILAEQMIGYDSILTGHVYAALLNAQKGSYADVGEHKANYEATRSILDDLLKKNARILLNQSTRPQAEKATVDSYLKSLDETNLLLADLEERAFVLMAKGDADEAYSLVVGGDYDKYKKELYEGYKDWADIENEITFSAQDSIIQQSQQIIYLNLILAIALSFAVFTVLMIIRSFLSKSIALKRKKKK